MPVWWGRNTFQATHVGSIGPAPAPAAGRRTAPRLSGPRCQLGLAGARPLQLSSLHARCPRGS
eukprot:3898820-Alexandrium_andersonii.AAC.1